jgi:hypothetical protein
MALSFRRGSSCSLRITPVTSLCFPQQNLYTMMDMT